MDATATYNFIPLPDKILPADLDAYHKDLLSDDEARRHKAFRAFLNKKESSLAISIWIWRR